MKKIRYPTKIIPPHYDRVFLREGLFNLFKEKPARPLVWINGPPGAGKTVFTVSLHDQLHNRYLWYRMDSCENNSVDLFYFLTLAAKRSYPHKRLKLPLFTSEYADDIEAFSRVFFRQLFSQLSNETAIILDNCQEAEQDEVFYKILLIAVSELPQDMQIFCLSRNRPSKALTRLQLNNELLEIGAAELQFNAEECRTFLHWLNPDLNQDSIDNLQSVTQGWVTGMVLLAEPSQQLHLNGFNNRLDKKESLVNYLLNEILSYLPHESVEFLVKTALFEQFTAEMAKQLTGYSKTQALLDDLINKNLLIDKTANTKPVYTYHPLLRDALLDRAHFKEQQWFGLQTQAAEILVQEEKPIEAMLLYRQLQNWEEFEKILLEQANSLIQAGRHRSVSQWIETFPENYLSLKPWLSYWYAEALKPVDPISAAKRLDNCYQQFHLKKDTTGVYCSWQAAVESITISMDDYSALEVWIQRFDELRSDYPGNPSLELKVKFYATAVYALSFYNPQHEWLKGLVRLSERAFRMIPVKVLRTMICTQLGHYYSICCELNKIQVLTPYLIASLQDDTLPVQPRIMNAFLLGAQNIYLGNGKAARGFLQNGIDLSNNTNISLFKGFLSLHQIACHICNGDLKAANKVLELAAGFINPQQRMLIAIYHSYRAWIHALAGEHALALEENDLTLKLTRRICVESGYIYSLALKAQILAKLSHLDKAQYTFDLLTEKTAKNNTKFNKIQYHLTDAWLGFLSGNQPRTLSATTRFFHLAQKEQILFFFCWQPDILAPLCLFAIENDIEVDYAMRMMALNHLMPEPPAHLEQWPRPVRIYSFQRLRIELNAQALEQSLAGAKKINELLCTIIALGGLEVDSEQLIELLWPDADGDIAQQSLETSVHRLRKLIGKQAILVKGGKISINSRYCWLDLWAFEATAQALENLLHHHPTHYHNIVKLTDRLLSLYQGPLLNNADSGQVIVKREQLQSSLNFILTLVADYYEQHQDNERAIMILKKGLELEPLLEANYLRLMSYYIKLEQPDQALHIYQQCCRTLSDGFGIPISEAIQSKAKQLQFNNPNSVSRTPHNMIKH